MSRTATNRAAPLLSVALLGALVVASVSPIWAGVRGVVALDEIPQDQSTCMDPTFRWMQDVVTTDSKVLAPPNTDSTCLQAYVPKAFPILYRVVIPQGTEQTGTSGTPVDVQDVQKFLNAPVVDGEMLQMLRDYKVSYVLLPQNSLLNLQLGHLRGITPLENPGERYRVYQVDYSTLGETPAVTINGDLNQGDPQAALSLLETALQGNEDERFLAYLAAGQANMKEGEHDQAVYNYEQALQLFPDSLSVYPLLADAHVAMDDLPAAVSVMEKAVALYPDNVNLHYKLGDLLLELGDDGDEKEALEHYRKVVERFPNVPEYRIKLGSALAQTGDLAATDKEFERAVDLNPISPSTYQDVGEANLKAGRLQEAAASYEEALRIQPENQAFAFTLGSIYFQLSSTGERDERYVELSEQHLRSAAESRETDSQDELRAQAYFLLGTLYRHEDRPEEAIAAYEKVLEIDSNSDLSANARQKLKALRKKR